MQTSIAKNLDLIGAKAFEYSMIEFLAAFCLENKLKAILHEKGHFDLIIINPNNDKRSLVEIKMYGRQGISIERLKRIDETLNHEIQKNKASKKILITNTTETQTKESYSLLKRLQTKSNVENNKTDLTIVGAETLRSLHEYYVINYPEPERPVSAAKLLSLIHHLERTNNSQTREFTTPETILDLLDPK